MHARRADACRHPHQTTGQHHHDCLHVRTSPGSSEVQAAPGKAAGGEQSMRGKESCARGKAAAVLIAHRRCLIWSLWEEQMVP
jgi:hypothetical protein